MLDYKLVAAFAFFSLSPLRVGDWWARIGENRNHLWG